MIESPTKEQLVDLIKQESGRCVSLLMRTHQSGRETNQNPIRFKNLISNAIEQVPDSDAGTRKRLETLAALEQDFEFWQHQSAGFALFVCEGFEQRMKLGHTPEDVVSVGDAFLVRPLAGKACAVLSAQVLALSWESARLFESDGHETSEQSTEGFPLTFDELVTERDPEEQLQYSSHGSKGQTGTPKVAMYHGHGEGEEKIEADRALYLSRVGDLLTKLRHNTDQPLLVLATDEVAGHFTSLTDVEVADVIHGSPDGINDEALRARIATAAHDITERTGAELGDRLGSALANNAGSTDIAEIVKQAAAGRVETLLLGDDQPMRGTFDRKQQQVSVSKDGAVDLGNLAVHDTLVAGGTVVELPGETLSHSVAAIYRY